MSWQALSIAWSNTTASGAARLVLIALADAADNSGYCFPSHRHLARAANISPRASQEAVRHLERLELIERTASFDAGGNGRQTSNLYRIIGIADAADAAADAADARRHRTSVRPPHEPACAP